MLGSSSTTRTVSVADSGCARAPPLLRRSAPPPAAGKCALIAVPKPGSEESATAPPALGHDPVDDRQPQARPLALGLGRVERLEGARGDLAVHADPGVLDREPDEVARLDRGVEAGLAAVELDVLGRHRERPAVRHGVARVEREVDQRLLDLAAVGLDRPELRAEVGRQLDVLAERALEERLEVGDDVVQDRATRATGLVAAEDRQLPRQRGAAPAGAPDLLDVGAHRGALIELVDDELGVVDDHPEDVVEVVGDAAGELPDRLEAAGLAELRVDRLTPGSPLQPESPGSALALAFEVGRDVAQRVMRIVPRSVSTSVTIASTGSSLPSPRRAADGRARRPTRGRTVSISRPRSSSAARPESRDMALLAKTTSPTRRRPGSPTARHPRAARMSHRAFRSQSSSLPRQGGQQ